MASHSMLLYHVLVPVRVVLTNAIGLSTELSGALFSGNCILALASRRLAPNATHYIKRNTMEHNSAKLNGHYISR